MQRVVLATSHHVQHCLDVVHSVDDLRRQVPQHRLLRRSCLQDSQHRFSCSH